jgi:hypothetical protein
MLAFFLKISLMTFTQHAHIYNFHTSNLCFKEIFCLNFYQYSPYHKPWAAPGAWCVCALAVRPPLSRTSAFCRRHCQPGQLLMARWPPGRIGHQLIDQGLTFLGITTLNLSEARARGFDCCVPPHSLKFSLVHSSNTHHPPHCARRTQDLSMPPPPLHSHDIVPCNLPSHSSTLARAALARLKCHGLWLHRRWFGENV